MSLPTAFTGASGTSHLPSSASTIMAAQIATTPEAAQYFQQQFGRMLEKHNESIPSLSRAIQELMQNTQSLYEDARSPWTGHPERFAQSQQEFKFKNWQENLANIAIENASSSQHTVFFDFALSEQSHLLRGYATTGQPVRDDTVQAMDTLFNAWLVEHGLLSQNGSVHEYQVQEGNAQEYVKPRIDSEGNPVLVDPQQLRQLMLNERTGFVQYVKQKNPDFRVVLREQEYPEPQQTQHPTAAT